VKVADNLWVQETELTATVNERWTTIQQWFSSLLAWRGIDEMVAEEMAFLPGMEELAYLLFIVDYAESGEYDVIVVDSAPTGETMRLLSFPEVLDWWMKRIFPIERQVVKVIRPVLKPLTKLPVPDEEIMDSVQTLFPQVDKMRTLLANPDVTTIRLVVNPEKMVIKETQRSFTYLNLYDYSTDLVVCNRLIPDSVNDKYFDYWKINQGEYYREIQERFAPLQILNLPLLEREVVGIDMLRRTSEEIFQNTDPTQIFYRGKTHSFSKDDGYYVLSFEFPDTRKEEISLIKNNDELIIQVGTYRRNITLPKSLANLAVQEARFEDGELLVKFVTDKNIS
jgi:arsenite-transporting ATPase